MFRRRILVLIPLLCLPASYRSGVFGGEAAAAQMLTPPPVSGLSYPSEVGADHITNYVQLGLTFAGSYVNNLYAGTTTKPLAEKTFSILPTISLDETRAIQHLRLTYHPGFTFYSPTSGLNEIDQSANVTYQRQLSPHSNISLDDEFRDSSTGLGPGYAGGGSSISGGSLVSTPGVIPPFAQRLENTSGAQWSWQTGPSSMIGIAGTGMILSYPNPSEAAGLYDSNTRGGSGFYSRRVSERQYLGLKYEYAYSVAEVPQAEIDVQAHTFAGFYTLYLSKQWSLSAVGGPERYTVTQTPFVNQRGWSPSVSVSVGRQGQYSNYAVLYSQSVTGGGGLAGAFYSKRADAATQLKLTGHSTVGLTGGYADNKAVSPVRFANFVSGHSIDGSLSFGYTVNDHLNLTCEYERIHQSYQGVPSIQDNPNSDRVALLITWQLTRPFGR